MTTISQRFGNLSPLKQALLALEEMEVRLADSTRGRREPIAIIGLSCRFPGAECPTDFWRLMENGTDAVSEIPASRWDIDRFYDANADAPGKMSSRWAGLLDSVDRFDPEFFGISPREATSMDPQQRLLLEVAWEAIENAGQGPHALAAGQTGVFVGMTGDEYAQLFYRGSDLAAFNAYFASGIARSVAGGRISYTLGLQGPNLSVDTACSSSLVALHTACLYLRMGECRTALAGGSNVILSPEIGIAFSKAHMMASDGRCKAFDSRADGFVRGEGCGIVVLKRLSDAVADGDNILAVIRGSAVNQDGRSGGLTVPNGKAQQAVIRQALSMAGVSGEQINYVEAHGTGTALGDPIEAHALAAVLGPGRSQDNPLVVGSVKTNIGHLESAAGVAGLIKVVLSLQHERIPSHLHFHQMNPHIDWAGVPVEIPTQGRAWPRGDNPRLAGVSSFGFSGTNAHVIVEEAPRVVASEPQADRPLHILTLSARTSQALQELNSRYCEALSASTASLADLCFTANSGRAQFEWRTAVVAASVQELRSKLSEIKSATEITERDGLRPAFLFSGQGSQYPGMGKQLYDSQPVFRKSLDRCAQLLLSELPQPLLEVLWGNSTHLLEQTAYTQPALFALEYSLAQLWKSWGVEPGVVLGHSVGEYVAACVAGVYCLEDGLRLIAARARLMQALPGQGAMTAVLASELLVLAALRGLEDRVSLAAVNAADSVVLSGYAKQVAIVEERLQADGIRTQRLSVSHAFHSPQMDAMADQFERFAATINYQAPRVRLISSVTGRAITEHDLNASYFRRQVRQPVHFARAMQTLEAQGCKVFLEIGPGTTLSGLGRQTVAGDDLLWAVSLKKGRGEWEQILESVAKLYERGAQIDWQGFDQPYRRQRVLLPTYPFQRQRYWIESKPAQKRAAAGKTSGHPLLGARFELAGAAKTYIWENSISTTSLPYLADHRAFGAIVFPLTAYLEMLTSAIADAGLHNRQLQDIQIERPLLLTPDEEKSIQVVFTDGSFEVYAREGESWQRHIVARTAPIATGASSESLAGHRLRMSETLDTREFYGKAKERGMDFGPAFRPMRELSRSTSESLARVEAPDTIQNDLSEYRIHPALLDGCLQALAALLPESDGNLYLPVGIRHFRLLKSPASRLWAHARIGSASESLDGSMHFDIRIFDDRGEVVAEAIDLHVRAVKSQTLLRGRSRNLEKALFELQWRPQALPATSANLTGEWLIVADRGGIGVRLARQLQQAGARCTIFNDGAPLEEAVSSKAWHGVIHMRALDAHRTESLTSENLPATEKMICESALDLIEQLSANATDMPPRLWFVTSDARAVSADQQTVTVTQAAIWGILQAVCDEHPDWRCACADLGGSSLDDSLEMLAHEIAAGDREDQIAFRGRQRFVARLAMHSTEPALDSPRRLAISTRGILDNLQVEIAGRRVPPAGHVEIQVDASGLNFRDVLNVLGMNPGDEGPLGSECVGHIVSLGAGISSWKVGDEVVAMVPDSHGGFVVADARLIARKPSNLSTEDAATLPTAFLTARYALETLAHIQRGDRVLIHAAAGGVGLAAVQIAQRAGAEIFATAGSDRKRDFLRSLGVKHVFNSRTVDFAAEIFTITESKGVDIVLNSLAGEFIPASFSVLARKGRFLEIGKRDLWTPEQARSLNREIAYHVIDLGREGVAQPVLLGALLNDTVQAVERGELRPLPIRVFSFRAAINAYRYMAQARHIGKIVLRQDTCGARIFADATYLITGGMGELGLQVARRFVERGARNLVLVGRSSPNSNAQSFIEHLKADGVTVRALAADVSRMDVLRRLFSEVSASMPPLRGIVHAAAILDDATLTQQTWERVERVMAPKAMGAWNLHELSANLPLDFFVMFSSSTSLLAAPGQANYAAANCFEDALAHYRRSQGKPAISINWGAWSAGLAMREGLSQRRNDMGIGEMSVGEGIALLDNILLEAPAQIGAGFIDWSKFLQRYPTNAVPPRFADLICANENSEQRRAGGSGLVERLQTAPESDRLQILRQSIHDLAVRVLGFSTGRRLDPQQPLSELGLDSLMNVEFRNALASMIARPLPTTLLFSYPAVEDVTAYLASLLSIAPKPETLAAAGSATRDLLDGVEGLSDEEVDRRLAGTLGDVK